VNKLQIAYPNPDMPEPRSNLFWGKKRFPAIQKNLDDLQIYDPENVPAMSGLNEITFVGSIPYGVVFFTKISICIKILSKNVKTQWIRD